MKKNIAKLTLLLALAAMSPSLMAQKVIVNREVETQNDGKMLLGTQLRSQFNNAPYTDWFQPQYDNYQIDAETLVALKKKKLKSYNFIVFVGTWCGDSHREFPRLMKILDELGVHDNKVTIIGTNRKKESPNGEEGLFNVHKVPTIIVKKYGKEIGRIIEYPKSGFLEKDLLEIIQH